MIHDVIAIDGVLWVDQVRVRRSASTTSPTLPSSSPPLTFQRSEALPRRH